MNMKGHVEFYHRMCVTDRNWHNVGKKSQGFHIREEEMICDKSTLSFCNQSLARLLF